MGQRIRVSPLYLIVMSNPTPDTSRPSHPTAQSLRALTKCKLDAPPTRAQTVSARWRRVPEADVLNWRKRARKDSRYDTKEFQLQSTLFLKTAISITLGGFATAQHCNPPLECRPFAINGPHRALHTYPELNQSMETISGPPLLMRDGIHQYVQRLSELGSDIVAGRDQVSILT